MIDWISVDDGQPENIGTVLLWREATDETDQVAKSLFGGWGFGWYNASTDYWYAGDNGAADYFRQGRLAITHWAELSEPKQ